MPAVTPGVHQRPDDAGTDWFQGPAHGRQGIHGGPASLAGHHLGGLRAVMRQASPAEAPRTDEVVELDGTYEHDLAAADRVSRHRYQAAPLGL